MKVLYILVSSPSDYYYEQALLSIMSAKYNMPKIPISLLMDDTTKASLRGKRTKILELVDEVKVVNFDVNTSPIYRSRSLKTSMRELIAGDFLYIDVDTLWTDSINEKDFDADVMGVPDGHVEFHDFIGYDYHMALIKQLKFNMNEKFYINGGVLFLRDSAAAHDFMNKWHQSWLYSCQRGVFTDQQSLNHVNSQMGGAIKLLSHCYNVQIANSARYLLHAKLIHFFGSAKKEDESRLFFELQKESFWKAFKEADDYFDLMRNIVVHPEKFFSASRVLLDAEIKYVKYPSYGLLCDIIKSKNKRAKIFLSFLNAVTTIVLKMFKTIS